MGENYKSIHIISEAIIVGGLSIYVYKKFSELESTIEKLNQQIVSQHNQLMSLTDRLATHSRQTNANLCDMNMRIDEPFIKTPLYPSEYLKPSEHVNSEHVNSEHVNSEHVDDLAKTNKAYVDCVGGVCTLSLGKNARNTKDGDSKQVAISKISKQIEFDRENNIDLDQSSSKVTKVNTFTKFSPNPVIKSVTPKPSISETDELDNILNEIDNE